MGPSLNDEDSVFSFVVKEGNGVKGLVDLGITQVPTQFIQPPNHLINNNQHTTAQPEYMTIDLSELDGPNHDQVVKSIAHAAETLGFFLVVNHGVPLELLNSLKNASHQFFSQPTEKKAVYLKGVSPSPIVRYGTSYLPQKGKPLEWRDYIILSYTNDTDALQFWPHELKEVVLEYFKTSKEMVKKLSQSLLTNLGVNLDEARLDTLLGSRTVSVNLYPSCPEPELTVGVAPHSDLGVLTVLLQDEIGGLYVKKEENVSMGNEEWIEIPPVDGALVINIGDALQILSNGRYKSAEHGARTTSIYSRVSVPIFIAPIPCAKIGPLAEVVARDGVARYRDMTFEEYLKNYFGQAHEGKKALDFASIALD